jgi:hypothetical protein
MLRPARRLQQEVSRMSTPAAPSTATGDHRTKGTSERRVASLFGLKGDSWMRHANPVSVWTRFAVLPLLALAVWSREWTDRDKAELPAQFRSRVLPATYAIQVVGMAILVYGLVELDLLAVVSGLLITQTAKAWFIDRMVLLYEDMKARDPSYAGWER